ncbi:zf-HC2 domain-containing protein [Streptomyces sp. ME19-01-6]|uniref:zf-HC2 domain-containing protein n=1 Tax=Streptomyces sp. ME19-01-6 TaxID=3028686 RepID=UPI0029A173B6|nr:zf-HC2 domain-containing protein [Streptomyces sp. ME19-01-6]MDX3225586.1 zf-HC2 domain-containing protein [Streptomyces sp. ME19-01-6]
MTRRRLTNRGGPAATWHVTPAHAASYADGSLPETDAWSVEKHVEACATCAERVSAAVREGAAAPALAEIRATVLTLAGAQAQAQAPNDALAGTGAGVAAGAGAATGTGATAATAAAAGVGGAAPAVGAARHGGEAVASGAMAAPHTAGREGPAGIGDAAPVAGRRRSLLGLGRGPARGPRAWMVWAAGPAVRGPWLVALLVTGVVAAGAARAAGVSGVRPLLLALAPVLPSAGVAVSYGRHADPMHELAASTPSGGLRLLLTRTAVVLAVSVPLLTLVGQLLPAAAGAPAASAWLLPGLALTLAALALASYVGCRIATCAVTAGWLLAVGAPAALAHSGDPQGPTLGGAVSDSLATVLSGPAAQGGWAAAAAVCAGLLALRRTSFDHLERM